MKRAPTGCGRFLSAVPREYANGRSLSRRLCDKDALLGPAPGAITNPAGGVGVGVGGSQSAFNKFPVQPQSGGQAPLARGRCRAGVRLALSTPHRRAGRHPGRTLRPPRRRCTPLSAPQPPGSGFRRKGLGRDGADWSNSRPSRGRFPHPPPPRGGRPDDAAEEAGRATLVQESRPPGALEPEKDAYHPLGFVGGPELPPRGTGRRSANGRRVEISR